MKLLNSYSAITFLHSSERYVLNYCSQIENQKSFSLCLGRWLQNRVYQELCSGLLEISQNLLLKSDWQNKGGRFKIFLKLIKGYQYWWILHFPGELWQWRPILASEWKWNWCGSNWCTKLVRVKIRLGAVMLRARLPPIRFREGLTGQYFKDHFDIHLCRWMLAQSI